MILLLYVIMSVFLVINSGSSSIRFALYEGVEALKQASAGKFERIGLPESKLTIKNGSSQNKSEFPIHASNHESCIQILFEKLETALHQSPISAIGHRVVHGGPTYRDPQNIDTDMLRELRRIRPFDPEHLPSQIGIIEACAKRYPNIRQIACFDTAFHRDLPRVAKLLPIPRKYETQGIQRYGFHGLSYSYLMQELERVAGPSRSKGRVVLAHLGNGSSMAAVKNGKCIDTTMSFTPTSGLVMSTRSGDLDPGLVAYLARTEGMTVDQFHDMVNKKSGLLGISETSSDMVDLEKQAKTDIRSSEAIELFCYQAKKWIGALATTMGGVDTIVLAGGIGENSSLIRTKICEGLEFLGIEIDFSRNQSNASIITSDKSKTIVRIIPTNEELYIATSMKKLLSQKIAVGNYE